MAAKKKGLAKTKPKKSKALVTKDAMAKRLAEMAEATTSNINLRTGSFISLSGKKFSVGETVLGNTLKVIILGFNRERRLFPSAYVPDSPSSPMCYSLGDDADQMTPADNSPEPQCGSCNDCEHDEWGSAPQGNGKACKEHVRLCVVDGELTDPALLESGEVEIPLLRIPVTSVKTFESYVEGLKKRLKLPCFAVVTEMSFDLEEEYPKVEFTVDSVIDDMGLLGALMEKSSADDVTDNLFQGYDPDMYVPEEPKKKRGGKKTSKKKTSKKKATAKRKGKFA